MLRYSLAGTLTLSWPQVVDAARTAERLGFDAFYATDHLTGVAGFAPELGDPGALSLAVALGPRAARCGRTGRSRRASCCRPRPRGSRRCSAGSRRSGVQRIVLSTPRPWHPGKLEALAAALALPRGVQAFRLVTGHVEVPVEFGYGIGLGWRAA
jgi:hypothetical protein